MSDREKVIRGLEVCTSDFCSEECPYYQCDGLSCHDPLMRDTLALLKEQEPRVLPWEKVDKSGNTYVWAEIRSFITDEKALIYCKIVNSEFFHGIYRLREESGMEWARTKEDYNRDDSQGSHSGWRCWTAQPTEEQRKAVPWNE